MQTKTLAEFQSRIPENKYAFASEVNVGAYTIKPGESINKDYNAYSKAWHRKFGPKVTVEKRYVTLSYKGGKPKEVIVPSWRGNWLLQALRSAGVIKPVKCPPNLRNIQLQPEFTVSKVRQIGTVAIYARLLRGSIWDYCAVFDGVTCHANNQKDAIVEVGKKIAHRDGPAKGVITRAWLRKAGFCRVGIQDFQDVYDLNNRTSVTTNELAEIIRANPELAYPFWRDLERLCTLLRRGDLLQELRQHV